MSDMNKSSNEFDDTSQVDETSAYSQKQPKDTDSSPDTIPTRQPKSQKRPKHSDDDSIITINVKRSRLPFWRKDANKDNDTNVLADDRRLQRILNNQSDENFSTMSIGERQEVLLLIRGMAERVVMEVGKVYKFGRFEIGASADNEIDMTPYGAQDRGVSRVHAQLQIIDGIVHITDLDSTNGTFVNTKQLDPHTPTPLRKGDELLLGRLAVQVLFRS
ncbi:MAG: FHA domain-containing protein [Chloroflexota bacterium]